VRSNSLPNPNRFGPYIIYPDAHTFGTKSRIGIWFAAASKAHKSSNPTAVSFNHRLDGRVDVGDGANICVGVLDHNSTTQSADTSVDEANMTLWFDEDQATGPSNSKYLLYSCLGRYSKRKQEWIIDPEAVCFSLDLEKNELSMKGKEQCDLIIDVERMAWMEYQCLDYKNHVASGCDRLAKASRHAGYWYSFSL
jgi:hypothetical protein